MQQPEYTPDGCQIYSHGYSVRVRIGLARDAALERLRRIDFPTGDACSRAWRRCNQTAHAIKGSKWLSERRPRGKSVLARRNCEWGTQLYTVAVDAGADAVFLDLAGVRRRDIGRFCERVLGLAEDEYQIAYYRRMERYVVLSPPDAHRLAANLGATPEAGRGRLSRMRWLIKEIQYPAQVRERATVPVRVKLYRVARGATATYRLEAWLEGSRRDRTEFHEADAHVLDERLKALLDEHGIDVIEKPDRWQPQPRQDRARDDDLGKLGMAAYRGTRAVGDALAKRHPPCRPESGVRLLGQAPGEGFRRDARVSGHDSPWDREGEEDGGLQGHQQGKGGHGQDQDARERPTQPQRHPNPGTGAAADVADVKPAHTRLEARHRRYVWMHSVAFPSAPDPTPTRAPTSASSPTWAKALATQIRRLPDGFISELVLDPNLDPTPAVKALLDAYGDDKAATAYFGIGDDIWYGLAELMMRHPRPASPEVAVLVVDPDVACLLADDWEAHEAECLQHGLPPTAPRHAVEVVPEAQAMLLWAALGAAREAFEHDGGKLVVMTADARPHHGRGALRRAHFRSDARVRSTLGHAGRHWAHVRYLVEGSPTPHRISMTKDEHHGVIGRIVLETFRGFSIWDRNAGGEVAYPDDDLAGLLDDVGDEDDFADLVDGLPESADGRLDGDPDSDSDPDFSGPNDDELEAALDAAIGALGGPGEHLNECHPRRRDARLPAQTSTRIDSA